MAGITILILTSSFIFIIVIATLIFLYFKGRSKEIEIPTKANIIESYLPKFLTKGYSSFIELKVETHPINNNRLICTLLPIDYKDDIEKVENDIIKIIMKDNFRVKTNLSEHRNKYLYLPKNPYNLTNNMGNNVLRDVLDVGLKKINIMENVSKSYETGDLIWKRIINRLDLANMGEIEKEQSKQIVTEIANEIIQKKQTEESEG